ncbi:MAG: DUF5335 family protein [Deltaproteobacteria bacterium]|nr:DUF5335 family protein [Deltaproteobacteria bacterium]
MPTREIPRDEWVAFFDSFSRQHEGWLSTVEVRGAEMDAQVESREQPLIGVTADLKEDDDVISILVGRSRDDHVAHMIHAPALPLDGAAGAGGRRRVEQVNRGVRRPDVVGVGNDVGRAQR